MDQIDAAMKRAVLIAILAAVAAAGATLPTTDDWRIVVGAVLAAFGATFAARIGEGSYDAFRASQGDVRPSDVGAYAAPLPRA